VYDSIKAHIKLNEPLDTSVFDGARIVNDGGQHHTRYWMTRDGIHLNYRISSDGDMLSIEFALSQYTNTPRHENPTSRDYHKALNRINEWFFLHLHDDIPDIRTWTVDRIDYAYNFTVDTVAPYIMMLNQLHLGMMSRSNHEHGVTWKNANRWVKFYDKGKQLNEPVSVLRYEVTNHRAAVRYMCKHWFGCARTVAELCHPMRALYVLSRMYEALGLAQAETYQGNVSLHTRLAALYPTQVATALGMYILITQYGSEAHTYALTTRGTYYRWLRTLRTHGLLPTYTHALSVLHNFSSFFIAQYSQNLKVVAGGADTSPQKISGENWDEIKFHTLGLKIEPTAMMKEAYERYTQAQIVG
jgi:hypothetical protein